MATLFWPFDPDIINYGFGYPPGYGGFHNGIDFPVNQGTPLLATVDGIIRNNDAGAQDGAGVDIRTPDGWLVRHWHVSKFLVANGSQVSAGEVIALTGGAKGTWGAGNSTGPHLHWGVQINNAWVNPAGLNPQNFGSNPNLQPSQIKEKEMYTVTNKDTKKTYTIGNQFIKHEQDGTRAAIVANITMGSNYNVPQLDQFGFDVFCDSMGVPRNIAAGLSNGASWSRISEIMKGK